MNEMQIMNIEGIECYEKDGTSYLRLETVARGLGFTQEKGEVEYIRWDRVENYLTEIGFPHKWGKEDFIPENIFYRLAMKAKNETAEKFQAKVADEIIPSIRKTGSYSMMPKDYATALRALADEVEKRERLEIENKIQGQIITEYQPKVDYYTEILNSSGTMTVSQIAKDYGMSAKQLNAILRDEHVQYNSRGQWLLYQDKASQGYTKSKTIPITYNDGEKGFKIYTEWNQKGRLFIHEILTKRGIKAIMDR